MAYTASMRSLPIALTGFVCTALAANVSIAQSYDELKKAIGDAVSDGWIYEDIDAGYAQAKRTGKPLLVSFR